MATGQAAIQRAKAQIAAKKKKEAAVAQNLSMQQALDNAGVKGVSGGQQTDQAEPAPPKVSYTSTAGLLPGTKEYAEAMAAEQSNKPASTSDNTASSVQTSANAQVPPLPPTANPPAPPVFGNGWGNIPQEGLDLIPENLRSGFMSAAQGGWPAALKFITSNLTGPNGPNEWAWRAKQIFGNAARSSEAGSAFTRQLPGSDGSSYRDRMPLAQRRQYERNVAAREAEQPQFGIPSIPNGDNTQIAGRWYGELPPGWTGSESKGGGYQHAQDPEGNWWTVGPDGIPYMIGPATNAVPQLPPMPQFPTAATLPFQIPPGGVPQGSYPGQVPMNPMLAQLPYFAALMQGFNPYQQ